MVRSVGFEPTKAVFITMPHPQLFPKEEAGALPICSRPQYYFNKNSLTGQRLSPQYLIPLRFRNNQFLINPT